MTKTKSADAGQAVYSKSVLAAYDLWVLGISNSFIWRCPTRHLREHFSDHASINHLDVGVGTGYYPDKCLRKFRQRLALLDLNQNSLDVTARRVYRFRPEIYRADVLRPLNFHCEKFDSISLNFLLHCLPGPLRDKAVVFRNLLPYLNPGGVISGSTILGRGVKKSYVAAKLMEFYNTKGIFDNRGDDYQTLCGILNENFGSVQTRVIGCVALFSARR